MKKIIFLLGLIGLIFTACDPTDSVYDDLDAAKAPYNEAVIVDFVDDDYADMARWYKSTHQTTQDSALADELKDKKAFSLGLETDKFIPLYLGNTYLALNKNSSAKVTFRFDEGRKIYLDDFEEADVYTLANTDYAAVDAKVGEAKGFYPNDKVDQYLPEILEGNIKDPEEGQMVRVSYKQFVEEPVIGKTDIFVEEFSGDLGAFVSHNLVGDNQQWRASDYNDIDYAKMSGFDSDLGEAFENSDWLVSPQIDLTNEAGVVLQINQVINFLKGETGLIKVNVSTDFDGADVAGATWTELVIQNKPDGTNYTYVESEEVDLSAYDGEKIYLGFHYQSTTTTSPTWQLDWIKVKAVGVSGETNVRNNFYEYKGSWKAVENAYVVSSKEYEQMGDPGYRGNFSSSVKPENYLPQLLASKNLFAQEGDTAVIAYNYYYGGSTGTKLAADRYEYHGTVWAKTEEILEKTEQYVHNGSAWFFDPTVSFTMGKDDFQMIVDAVKDTHPELIDRGNSEYYHGASAWYSNFDMRHIKRTNGDFAQAEYDGLTADEIQAKIEERVQEGVLIMLKAKFPEAVTQVNGIDVNYIVRYKVYDNDLKKPYYSVTYKCTKAGPSAGFELVEGPVEEI
ncbi:MAG: choice-of-anchor J domain-containing protein [Marinilabiliaceae bacterium]|nr:choice-of-anchor J domain-containing protein [Marinilabiliaceae bacterium]